MDLYYFGKLVHDPHLDVKGWIRIRTKSEFRSWRGSKWSHGARAEDADKERVEAKNGIVEGL
jgi:hypothetical protein